LSTYLAVRSMPASHKGWAEVYWSMTRSKRVLADCNRSGALVGHNTYLRRSENDFGMYYAVVFHSTEIVAYWADGRLVLDAGEWQTVTTKQRINVLLPSPWAVYTKRLTRKDRERWKLPKHRDSDWFLCCRGEPVRPFHNGMRVHPEYGAREDQ